MRNFLRSALSLTLMLATMSNLTFASRKKIGNISYGSIKQQQKSKKSPDNFRNKIILGTIGLASLAFLFFQVHDQENINKSNKNNEIVCKTFNVRLEDFFGRTLAENFSLIADSERKFQEIYEILINPGMLEELNLKKAEIAIREYHILQIKIKNLKEERDRLSKDEKSLIQIQDLDFEIAELELLADKEKEIMMSSFYEGQMAAKKLSDFGKKINRNHFGIFANDQKIDKKIKLSDLKNVNSLTFKIAAPPATFLISNVLESEGKLTLECSIHGPGKGDFCFREIEILKFVVSEFELANLTDNQLKKSDIKLILKNDQLKDKIKKVAKQGVNSRYFINNMKVYLPNENDPNVYDNPMNIGGIDVSTGESKRFNIVFNYG